MTEPDSPQPNNTPNSDAELLAQSERLRAELRALGAFVPTTILRDQLETPMPGRTGGAYWQGSVLFADLSGFTALSETLSSLGKQGAEEISTIINRLFGTLVEEILHYGGEVLKFGGDALTAFFDQASLGPAHAPLAAQAALALQKRMRSFAATTTPVGTFRLRLRIGVHSGRVFAAQVGDAEHVELLVTGRDINRVALAQEIAEAGETVVSDSTLALLPAARSAPRQGGFHVLVSMPKVAPPAPPAAVLPLAGTGNQAELQLLESQVAALRSYLPRQLPRRFLDPSLAESGEFRTVTVLFANFFPFNGVLELLDDDPATAAQALNTYYLRTQQIVQRYGGIVNKVDMYTYGDKLMALFGAPAAHENDPELAARAALELRASLPAINAEIAALLAEKGRAPELGERILRQRIGINTGVMFAGLVGGAQRREYTVLGQHVNLAARLMSSADESIIALSPTTRRAVERHIATIPLEPVQLKGIAEPVAPAAAIRAFDVAQDQARVVGHARLVGRDAELQAILANAATALAGAGRVVALAGEAGVGKSRLIEEALREMVIASAAPAGLPPFFPYSVECQSYEQNTPYALIRQLLRLLLNLDFLESVQDAAAVGRRVAELAPDLARFAPLLADLTVAQIEDTPLTAALAPEQRRDRARDLVEAIVLGAARGQPQVIILDDLHWADASSLELLSQVVARAHQVPMLLLLGYRTDPPIAEPWLAYNYGRRIDVRELSPADSTTLVGELLGGSPLAELAIVLEKTQGNPFYIEEVVRGLIEAGVLARGPTGWQSTRPIDETLVPDSIEGVITARLDRLEERSREVLQVASVVGRRFPYQVLLGSLLQGDDLQERLGRLTQAELILIEEIERELAYLFKNALTRDVAYEAILYARRRELHRTVANQIEQLYPDRIEEQLGVLGRHYLLAEDWPQAFDYHLRAGRQAQGRYANREAIAFLERALQIAKRMDGGQRTVEDAEATVHHPPSTVEIYERLGVIHTLIGEYDLALTRYAAALEALRQQPEVPTDALVRLHHHTARVYEKRAEFETAFQWVEQALALDPELQGGESVRVLLLGAGLHRRQGRFAQALEWGERARERAEALASVRDQAHALKLLGGTYLGMGDNRQAYELLRRCLDVYSSVNDLSGRGDAHNDLANTCYELGQLDEARSHYEAGYEIKQAIGDIYGQAMISNNLGNLLKLLGNNDQAIEQYQRSLVMFERIGSAYVTGVLHMNLGAAYLLNDMFEQAEHHLGRSVDLFAQAGAEDFLPELERYLAELQLRCGDMPRALLACELALATAARLEARAEEAITRRVYAQALAQLGDAETAWYELEQSLAVLREVNNRYETARTLGVLARVAPKINQHEQGQRSFDEAVVLLQALGASYDVEQLKLLAREQGYGDE